MSGNLCNNKSDSKFNIDFLKGPDCKIFVPWVVFDFRVCTNENTAFSKLYVGYDFFSGEIKNYSH